jgi:hypothetical protein
MGSKFGRNGIEINIIACLIEAMGKLSESN